MSKLPCKHCVLYAICRHKFYDDILKACELINEYLEGCWKKDMKEYKRRLLEFEKFLDPTSWFFGAEVSMGYSLNEIDEDGHFYT